MVQPETLDALDLLVWLGSGAAAAERCRTTQSTISRRVRHCLQVFEATLQRLQGNWNLRTSNQLLDLERVVHQRHRLLGGGPLRIDGSHLAAELLTPFRDGVWVVGPGQELGSARPLRLLRDHILDAWVCGMGQELAGLDPNMFRTVDLLATPLNVQGLHNHPLIAERHLKARDLHDFPRLAPAKGAYPCTEGRLRSLQQIAPAMVVPLKHYRHRLQPPPPGCSGDGPGPLSYGTVLSRQRLNHWHPLDLDLGVTSRITVVMRTDVATAPALESVVVALASRSQQLARDFDRLQCLVG